MALPTPTDPALPPQNEQSEKKVQKKKDGKSLKSFTIRVEDKVIQKLLSVGQRTGEIKIAKIARNYLRLGEIFALENNRFVGHDSKELALVPVEILRSLVRRVGNSDESTQIDLGNEFGKFLRNVFYLDPGKTVEEKMEFIRRLGWFSPKRDRNTKQVLITTDFGPDLVIQAMIYQIALGKEMPKPPIKEKDRKSWADGIEKEKMKIEKNLDNEIGFKAFLYEEDKKGETPEE